MGGGAGDEEIGIDLGEEYEQALQDANQEEIIDLAAILGFHSMMNQDQYHASLLNKGQPVGLGWDGITKASQQKVFPNEGPNKTNIDDSIRRVKDDDQKLVELNLNNIKVRERPGCPGRFLTYIYSISEYFRRKVRATDRGSDRQRTLGSAFAY